MHWLAATFDNTCDDELTHVSKKVVAYACCVFVVTTVVLVDWFAITVNDRRFVASAINIVKPYEAG